MKRIRGKIILIGPLLPLVAVVTLGVMSFMARKPDSLGLIDGALRKCPERPNCVCSQHPETESSDSSIAPLSWNGSPESAWQRLRTVVEAMPRTRLVRVDDDYMHVEYRSWLFRFVDNVEFLLDRRKQLIHFRSASRVGRSDLGANRRRMEDIRRRFNNRASGES